MSGYRVSVVMVSSSNAAFDSSGNGEASSKVPGLLVELNVAPLCFSSSIAAMKYWDDQNFLINSSSQMYNPWVVFETSNWLYPFESYGLEEDPLIVCVYPDTKKIHCSKMHRVGFEPTPLSRFDLESNALDHSAIDATHASALYFAVPMSIS